MTTHDEPVTFPLSGQVVRLIRDGNWPTEQPEGFAAITSAPFRRAGRGGTYAVTLPRDIAADLADYLWSVAEVNTVGEGRSANDGNAARSAVTTIEAALSP